MSEQLLDYMQRENKSQSVVRQFPFFMIWYEFTTFYQRFYSSCINKNIPITYCADNEIIQPNYAAFLGSSHKLFWTPW